MGPALVLPRPDRYHDVFTGSRPWLGTSHSFPDEV